MGEQRGRYFQIPAFAWIVSLGSGSVLGFAWWDKPISLSEGYSAVWSTGTSVAPN